MEKSVFVTLPKKKKMLKRLCVASNNEHLRERFYPLLFEKAGKRLATQGVIMMLIHAMRDYTRCMEKKHADIMTGILCEKVPEFIDALVADEGVARDAKKMFADLYAEVCALLQKGGVGDAQNAADNSAKKT